MDEVSNINPSIGMDTVPHEMRTVAISVDDVPKNDIVDRLAVDEVSKAPLVVEELTEETRLRDKIAAVRRMRANEVQEALARECDLSRIINELQRRQREAEASHLRDRQTHERHTANLVRENTALRAHICALEATLHAQGVESKAKISLFESRLAAASDLVVQQREQFKQQELTQERGMQQLCASLYSTQVKLEKCEEEVKELRETRELLRVMTAKWAAACQECQLWVDVLGRRERCLLVERDALVDMQCNREQERINFYRKADDKYREQLMEQASARVEVMRDAVGDCEAMKQQFLDSAQAALEHKSLVTRYSVQAEQLSDLSQRYEALVQLLKQRTRELSACQEENVENAAWMRALDDATIGYVLHQRDEEVRDKLSRWKDWLLEAHAMLRALLKRYEPFQRGDEVFVQHVIECLSAAPHVKDPVNVILP